MTLGEWLGFRKTLDFERTRRVGATLGVLLTILGLCFSFLFVVLLFSMFAAAFSTDDAADVRNIGLVLAALIGAPFLVWRSVIAAKQVSVAEESLFNDKINAAAEDLAARRQVSHEVGEGSERKFIDEWQDDLVTRAAAIDRLEGLANERPDTAPRIARMLSVYVRELSSQDGLRAKEPPADAKDDVKALAEWAQSLSPIRSDMEKAAQTLGGLKRIEDLDPDHVPIDLRGANLQGYDLKNLCFDNALFEGANLEGANLSGAGLDSDSNFTNAVVQYAFVKSGDLSMVNLNQDQANSMFGDGSVILPDGITRPGHWPNGNLNYLKEFLPQSRAWQKAQGYAPPQ